MQGIEVVIEDLMPSAEKSAAFLSASSPPRVIYYLYAINKIDTNKGGDPDEGISAQTLGVIVETGITTIASIIFMIYERKKDGKRQALQSTIDEAKRKMERL